jgi:hypothetical protein
MRVLPLGGGPTEPGFFDSQASMVTVLPILIRLLSMLLRVRALGPAISIFRLELRPSSVLTSR